MQEFFSKHFFKLFHEFFFGVIQGRCMQITYYLLQRNERIAVILRCEKSTVMLLIFQTYRYLFCGYTMFYMQSCYTAVRRYEFYLRVVKTNILRVNEGKSFL